MRIGVLILAAGASRRLGKPKQLLRFEGKTLLRRAAETALSSDPQKVLAVLGSSAADLKNEICDLPLETVVAKDWENGMSASIRAGLTGLIDIAPALPAIVLMLCDQPLVTFQTIKRLIETFEKTKMPIVAAEYNGTIGVPALFASEMFDQLLSLKGDAGARALIKNQADCRVTKIIAPEAAFDVDTIADYEKLIRLDKLP